MPSNRLNIVSVENNDISETRIFRPKTNRQEVQAQFEKLWHRDPKRFDPLKDCMGRERIARTLAVIDCVCPVSAKKAVDLGCGSGVLSRKLRDVGAQVTAVDIAKNALENFHREDDENITVIHDCVPHTKLDDGSFDVVICTDVLGYLKPREHRLFISELTRLVKDDGYIVCSTPIDVHSEDALERLSALAETELTISKWKLSYHRYYIWWLDFFKAPMRFARAGKENDYREKALSQRFYLGKWWFKINSSPVIGDVWSYLQHLSKPVYHWLQQNPTVMRFCEKMCRFVCNESGISHVIFVAQRRPLMETPPVEAPPIEMKKKKSVWE